MINPSTHAITEFPVTHGQLRTLWNHGRPRRQSLVHFEIRRKIGKINPTTHAITEFPTVQRWPVRDHGGPGRQSLVHRDFGNDPIGEINPTTHAISEFSVAQRSPARDHGRPRWQPLVHGATAVGSVRSTRRPTRSPSTPSRSPDSAPYAITTGPDGNLWFMDYGDSSIGVATLATSQLVVTAAAPPSVTAGSSFGLTVEAEDSLGNLITSFNGTVTVALANNPGGATLGGTLTATASNGIAMFSGLTLTTAAVRLFALCLRQRLRRGITSAITVTPAVPTQLVITTSRQPPSS